jgi:hypothetical protein
MPENFQNHHGNVGRMKPISAVAASLISLCHLSFSFKNRPLSIQLACACTSAVAKDKMLIKIKLHRAIGKSADARALQLINNTQCTRVADREIE